MGYIYLNADTEGKIKSFWSLLFYSYITNNILILIFPCYSTKSVEEYSYHRGENAVSHHQKTI